MASANSERVMEQRSKAYDRVSILINRGGKHLLHAQALREDVSIAEMMRRAILARVGLEQLPPTEALSKLATVTTRQEADAAIQQLQHAERAAFDTSKNTQRRGLPPEYVLMASSKKEMGEYIVALLDLLNEVEDAANRDYTSPQRLKLNERVLPVLRRLLANIDEIQEKE